MEAISMAFTIIGVAWAIAWASVKNRKSSIEELKISNERPDWATWKSTHFSKPVIDGREKCSHKKCNEPVHEHSLCFKHWCINESETN